jgi:hypothetical protein
MRGVYGGEPIHRGDLRHAPAGPDVVVEARENFTPETRAADDRAMLLKVQDAVASMFSPERFEERLKRYRRAGEREIGADPVRALKRVGLRFNLTKEERAAVLRHLIKGGELSQLALADAVTRVAGDQDGYDRATALERVAGGVVELKAKEWRGLAG